MVPGSLNGLDQRLHALSTSCDPPSDSQVCGNLIVDRIDRQRSIPACHIAYLDEATRGALSVESAWVRLTMVRLMEWAVPPPCTPVASCTPRLLIRTGTDYSFGYVPRENAIHFNPVAFEGQLERCRWQGRCLPASREGAEDQRVQIIIGNLAHELGHWYFYQSGHESSHHLSDFCGTSWCSFNDGARPPFLSDLWEELYSDFMAGYLLASKSDGTALYEFFAANESRVSGTHPEAVYRERAVLRGVEVGRAARAAHFARLERERPISGLLGPTDPESTDERDDSRPVVAPPDDQDRTPPAAGSSDEHLAEEPPAVGAAPFVPLSAR
jgi:hypothetical protein